MLDGLAALRLQLDWGVDEALGDVPLNRLSVESPMVALRVVLPARSPSPALVPALMASPGASPGARVAGLAGVADLADLAAVHAALDGFRAHPLRATASATVPPGGNVGARLLILADAPGADDDRSGQAFSGKAGALLERVFGAAGLGRERAMLTFLIPWRPPGGRAPSEAEVALVLPYLYRMLALARPRHLVLLGEVALRTLVDTGATLRGHRGRWTGVVVPGLEAPVPALPMLAPERWLQSPATRQQSWTDLLTLREALAQH